MDHRIEKILGRVKSDISQKPVIRDLVACVNASSSYFQHLFKQEVGISNIKYVNNIRLEKARLLLETTDLRVKEIRVIVGITNEAHFLRGFKQKFGQAPNNHRIISKNEDFHKWRRFPAQGFATKHS